MILNYAHRFDEFPEQMHARNKQRDGHLTHGNMNKNEVEERRQYLWYWVPGNGPRTPSPAAPAVGPAPEPPGQTASALGSETRGSGFGPTASSPLHPPALGPSLGASSARTR